jgi:Ion channel
MNKFFEWLSKINPLWFLTVYLGCIPVFGLLYAWAVPHGFVAPYARYEPSVRPDEMSVKGIIRRSLIGNTQWKFGDFRKNSVRLGGNTYDLDSINVWFLEVLGTTSLKAVFDINGCCVVVYNNANFRSEIEITIDVTDMQETEEGHDQNLHGQPSTTIAIAEYKLHSTELSFWADDSKEKMLPLFDLLFSENWNQGAMPIDTTKARGSGCTCIVTTKEEARQIESYVYGILGDSSELSGQIFRMIYLSSVVITTLGLGDIIPITAGARFLVGFEAVFGVTLAGLFFNSISHRAAEKNR